MGGQGKLIVAAGVAAVGVGAAVWSAMSMQRRPAPVPRAELVGGGGGGGGNGGGAMRAEVRLPAELAAQVGMTPEELNARASELASAGKSPEEIAKELGLPEGAMRVERQGGPGGGPGGEGEEFVPPPAGPFAFVRPASAVDASGLGSVMEERVKEAAGGVDGVDAVRGDPMDLGRAARLALVEAARGRAEFATAVRELGGELAEDGAVKGSAAGLADMLEGAWIDATSLRVRRVEVEEEGPLAGAIPPPRDGGAGGADGAGGGSGLRMATRLMRMIDNGEERELATTTMPVGDVWPRAVDEVGDGVMAMEIRCAVKVKGLEVEEGMSELAVVMVRERDARAWQPVEYRLYCRDGRAVRGFMQARRGGG